MIASTPDSDNRKWCVVLLCATTCHAFLALRYVGHVWTTALGVTLVLGVMVAFCLTRACRSGTEIRWHWVMLCLALVLWDMAYWAITWLQAHYPDGARVYFDELFFMLRLIPYLLILARGQEHDATRPYRLIDGAQALLLAGLLFYLLYPSIFPHQHAADPAWDKLTSRYHAIINMGAAVLSIFAIAAQPDPVHRRFAIALAALLTSYWLDSALMNGWVFRGPNPPPPGHVVNVTFAIPFFLFLFADAAAGEGQCRIRHSRLIGMLMPTAFCAASMFVAIAIGTQAAALAAGAGLMLMGLRAALLQTELIRLERFVARLVDHLPDAICVVAPDDIIRSANPAATQIFGMACIGQSFADLRRTLGQLDADTGQVVTQADRAFVLAEVKLGGGERIVRLTDVTALRTMEREREDTLHLLGHDIRSPYAEILTLLDQSRGETLRVDWLRRHAQRGLAMADDFVRLARARTALLRREPVDLADVAAEAADMSWARAKRRRLTLRDESDLQENGIWIDGDHGLLMRAIHNLLDNAVRFAPEGATVHYGVRMLDEKVRFFVTSAGPELPDDRRADPFARFGGRGDRIGLGLTLVHVASLRHGGTASYQREGAHNVFTMDLPLAP